ncbi:MAG: HYR domain-containing protein, partial [Chitinophagales bacterium]
GLSLASGLSAGSYTVTVTDGVGCTASISETVTSVEDETAPVFTACPTDITLYTEVDQCCASVVLTAPAALDECGTVVVTQTAGFTSGQCFELGENTVVFTAVDLAGNSTECSFSITVVDGQLPNAICQDITIDLDASGAAVVTASQLDSGSNDNCTLASDLQFLPASVNFNCADVGDNNIQLIVTDQQGNSSACVATVTVRDAVDPVITSCPPTFNLVGCVGVVPSLVSQVVATDACGIASITQNPSAGVNVSGGVITFTVTDLSGNTSTCSTPIVINDATAPVFITCPTTMVMVSNDPDQCSAKVNWSIPAANDLCSQVIITQLSGPVPGEVIPLTCPPSPLTVVYQASDDSGNTATCSFQVTVVDSQKPEFDADITMPSDITVECQDIPSNCVFHGNGICSPLTVNDVNDNCSGDLTVSFSETSTQNVDPTVCAHYDYTLTRTWTVTDCAGNARQHTQVIDVYDTTAPIAVCQNLTVTLNNFGSAAITAKQLDGGSTDNCAVNANLGFTASQTTFSCADYDLSPVAVTLTVTDPCGNTGTCVAFVTILQGNANCSPSYDVTGSDPCVCLDNATTADNGQFGEFIQIHALAGQIWTLVGNNGLYTENSPAPPASPVLIAAGITLIAGNNDGVDNDGDGTIDELEEAVFYSLRGRHVDALGYTATFSNGTDEFTISNKCYYPNAYFTNLNDPFCLSTPEFTIEVGEYGNASGVIENVTVNGQATTVFNANQLGEGFHTVMAVFNAGAAQPFIQINGIPVVGSDSAAQLDPGCKQSVTKIVQVVGTPTTVVCNDTIYVSLDASCAYSLTGDDALEGTYGCYDDYSVTLDKTLPMGNGPWLPATVNAGDIGKYYTYQLTHSISGNLCMGVVKIEDKLAPAITCPADVTVACSESTAVSTTGNVQITDCSATSVQIDDEIVDNGECGNPRRVITRTFLVTDVWGNQSICTQVITIKSFDMAELVLPSDITVDCEDTYGNPLATAPVNTGAPSIDGAPIGQGTICSASISYTDVVQQICGGSFEILREWVVRNTCLPISSSNPVKHTQIIRVKDFGGPQFACPGNVTVSTDPAACCATAALPNMLLTEGCSGVISLKAKISGADPATGNQFSYTLPGTLSDFPGNNYWDADTMAVFSYTQCLPKGNTYTVTYTAEDGCNNLSSCQFLLTIEDLVPPALACDEFTQVALAADGTALVNAGTFDDGSVDNCGPVFFKARRMNSNDCQTDTLFHDEVKFCCSDLSDTVSVILRVYDASPASGSIGFDAHLGNYNECMVNVLVEDKIKPICTAPANVTVSCEAFDPSLWAYETATGQDNCCMDTITYSVAYNQFDTLCNKGTITRRWTAVDCGGNTASCSQRVIVTYN